MVQTKGVPKSKLYLSADLDEEYWGILNNVIEENNCGSRREGLAIIFEGYKQSLRNPSVEPTSEVPICDFFLSANKKYYCVYESYGRHRQLVSKEECLKCKIHLWNLPKKTRIPLCPVTNGLFKPTLCETCSQTHLAIYSNCETRRFLGVKTEHVGETTKTEKPSTSARAKDIERLKEREKIRNDALKERYQIEVDAEREKRKLRNQRSIHSTHKVDWGGVDSFDAFSLGDN